MTAEIGHNNPPEPTPFELSKEEAETLLVEARNWADGSPIESQEQADTLTGLLALIKAAITRIDERRDNEVRPLNEQVKAINTAYNGLIGDTKSSGKGSLILAREAVLAVLEPWRKKIDDEKKAAAEKLRQEQLAKQAEAEEAFRKARAADDLAAKEEAERLAVEAQKAQKEAKKAEKQANTGTGLRTVVSAEVIDMQVFARWVWKHDVAALGEFLTARADELAKAGRRDMEGVTVKEERVAK